MARRDAAPREAFASWQLTVLCAWAVIVVAAVCWPFAASGEFIWRDMVIIDHPALSAANFGGGDLPARNAPQDGLLALAGTLIPAPYVARVLIFSAAAAAAAGALWLAHLAPRPGLLGTAAAIVTAVASPLVVERLLQGQWSLVIAAWLLPFIAAACLTGRRLWAWLALFGASLTPTGALTGLAVAMVCARGRNRWLSALVGLVYCLPWALPGAIDAVRGGAAITMDAAASTAAFAPRAEAYVGTLGALAGLGGIWNVEAVPESRQVGFALFGIAVACLVLWGAWIAAQRGAGRTLAPLAVLAAVGFGVAMLGWAAPGAGTWLLEHVPGAGLLRDGQKFMMLAVPFYAFALANVRGNWAVVALICVLLQTPDAPRALSVLQATDSGVSNRLVAETNGRDTYFVDRGALVETDGRVSVDPYSKALSKVESGALAVDGSWVDAPSPRWLAVREAWEARDLERLEQLGVGVVIDGEAVVARTEAPKASAPWGLTAVWLLSPLLAAALALTGRGPGSGPSATKRGEARRGKAKRGQKGRAAKPRNARR